MCSAGLLYYVYSMSTELCVQYAYYIMCRVSLLYYMHSRLTVLCTQQAYLNICTQNYCIICTVSPLYYVCNRSAVLCAICHHAMPLRTICIYYSVLCYTLALLLRFGNAVTSCVRRVMCLCSHLFEEAKELKQNLFPVIFLELPIFLLQKYISASSLIKQTCFEKLWYTF